MRYIRQAAFFQPYPSGSALGVSKLELSPNKQYILAGFNDEKMRMINSMSWRELFSFDHSWDELTEINSSDILNIYQECDSSEGVYYKALGRPFRIPRILLQDQEAGVGLKKDAKRGISKIAVSYDSRFCATKCETTPNCVWVWDLVEMSLNSLLVQHQEISDFSWNPRTHNLNICSGANRLFLWSPKGASVCQVPTATSTVVKQKTGKIVSNGSKGQVAASQRIQLDLAI